MSDEFKHNYLIINDFNNQSDLFFTKNVFVIGMINLDF